VLALSACNAILGAGDYHVGKDGGAAPAVVGDDGGGLPGSGATSSSAGGATGSGGRTSGGTAGKGSGGRAAGGTSATGGKGGTNGMPAAQDLVGEWDSDAETITTDCGDGNPTSQMSSDKIEWMLGTGGSLVTTFLDTCVLMASLKGNVVSISPPVTCDDNGLVYMISGSFTLQADGRASLVEVVTFTSSGITCTLTGKGLYTKFVP
jgi:hypothetical protein